MLQTVFKYAVVLSLIAVAARAQSTAFNFQGKMNDGASPANGRYDLQFRLFNAPTGGAQVGPTVDKSNTMLVNGVFSTVLDFGAVFSGGVRFIEISVRPNGSLNPHVILGGRQQILSVPFAVRSLEADTAASAQFAENADNAANAANAATAQNSLSLGGVAASFYARLNATNTGEVVTTGNIRQSGNAHGVVKLAALVNPDGTIARCYNGIHNVTAVPCGFSVTRTGPFYKVDFSNPFGFLAYERFISVTPYPSGQLLVGANIFTNPTFPTAVFVAIFDPGKPTITAADPPSASFQIMIF
jgi:hypothetical protein